LACAAVSAFPLTESNLFFTLICGGTTAGILGFLVFNWNPARMFMGDTGSQMLGVLLAAVGVIFFWNNEAMLIDHSWYSKIAIVLTAFIVPIGDSITVTINRIKRGQSPFVGGRDHTTHHLFYAGLTNKQVAYVMIALSSTSLGLITGLKFIPNLNLPFYMSFLFLFSASAIIFLYSTTVWKKSKSAFKASQPQHN
jgi:UDP-GlcNAc:undecaprenyl-phosphate GlcNAc-1-phosphate transferase